jgi:hypothetical protein
MTFQIGRVEITRRQSSADLEDCAGDLFLVGTVLLVSLDLHESVGVAPARRLNLSTSDDSPMDSTHKLLSGCSFSTLRHDRLVHALWKYTD